MQTLFLALLLFAIVHCQKPPQPNTYKLLVSYANSNSSVPERAHLVVDRTNLRLSFISSKNGIGYMQTLILKTKIYIVSVETNFTIRCSYRNVDVQHIQSEMYVYDILKRFTNRTTYNGTTFANCPTDGNVIAVNQYIQYFRGYSDVLLTCTGENSPKYFIQTIEKPFLQVIGAVESYQEQVSDQDFVLFVNESSCFPE